MEPREIRHVLGRVGFGATETDVELWTGRTYDELVDWLLTADPITPLPDDALRLTFATGADTNLDNARIWWLERMRTTPYPLLEKMTLLWHDHFATGVRYPPTLAQLAIQNQTLRAHALGSFRALAEAMNTDPAMLYWLNGVENAPPRSNENYAREFFELFTLGKSPQVYTEVDIRQAAKAFTGWYVDGANQAVFAESRHNTKNKKVLGRTIRNLGAEEHKELVDVALAQKVAPTFVATKLVTGLAYVPGKNDTLVRDVAGGLAKDWDISNAVRRILRDQRFRAPSANTSQQYVRTPVECVVHAAKVLDVRIDSTLTWFLERMGHALYDPVDVSGWPVGRDWISPATALARYDAALHLHARAAEAPTAVARPLPDAADLDGWAERLGMPVLTAQTRKGLAQYLKTAGKHSAFDRRAGVFALLFSSPEWVVH